MTHLLVQSRNDSEHEGTPQTDSLRDLVNHALIAIAQEVAELLKKLIQQADDTDYLSQTEVKVPPVV